jgi:hypothetical protein
MVNSFPVNPGYEYQKVFLSLLLIRTNHNPYHHKKLIRIKYSNMERKFEEVENDRIKIELIAAGDTGSDIPQWF